jgi:hypothetical protein
MTPPEDREIFEGEIATYWLDDGVLISLSKSSRANSCEYNGKYCFGQANY